MQTDEIGHCWWDGRVNRTELEHLLNIRYANTSCHLTSWLLTEVEEERQGGSPERPSEALDRWPAGGENSCLHFWLWCLPGACLEEKSPGPSTRADGGRISSGEVGFSSGSVQENEWRVTLWRICRHHDYRGPHLYKGQRNSLQQVINSKRSSNAESLR